ncbi:MAG: DUF58 domain-containing protein, partial [Gammaproteobacteria bacterium]|nr:DUF58 domain-containing protein [Gammaproteobacteria bacterium]
EAATPREEVFLDWPGSPPVPAGLGPLDSRLVRLPLETRRRGARPLPGLRVGTRAPLGLMHAWAWVHIDAQLLVWPRPAAGPVPLPNSTGSHRPHDGHQRPGDEDFAGLRSYRRGDSPRRIAWKSYARCGELLVRDFRGGGPAAILWLDWNTLPPGDVEQRVAWLTRQVLDAAAGDRPWGLRVPGITVEPAQGREHLRRCLEQLAVVAPEALP